MSYPAGFAEAPAWNHLLMRIPWRRDPRDLVDLVESLPAVDCEAYAHVSLDWR